MDFSHIYSSKVGGNNRLDYLTMKMTVITYICKKGGGGGLCPIVAECFQTENEKQVCSCASCADSFAPLPHK